MSEHHPQSHKPRGGRSLQEARVAKHVDEQVGERIRQRRTMLGLTQEQLATALKISYQQVQKYETGSNRVSAGRLYEIANFLSVDINYFFDGMDGADRSEPLPHGGRNRSAIELVRNFTAIEDPAVRAAVASLVKALSRPHSGQTDGAGGKDGADGSGRTADGHDGSDS